jgi:hypothetical protein
VVRCGAAGARANARFLSANVPWAMGTVLPSHETSRPAHPAPLAERVPGTTLSPGVATDERAARQTLRAQIARLECELANAFVTAFPMGGLPQPAASPPVAARLLDLGELEVVRDELAQRLHEARDTIAKRADEIAEKRLTLERMLLAPADYKFARISCRELGEPGCGVWQVRPRMGLIGMLMGWWQVKLSSGCPLSRGHGAG